jgi:hypothetical protein
MIRIRIRAEVSNMNEMNREKLRKISREIRQKYIDWDRNVKAGQNPVPIQDLDYWPKQLDFISNYED